MKIIRINRKFSTLLALLALTISPAAWGYDSAINAGLGHYSFDYRDQTGSMAGERLGWRMGYLGRFNDYLGFDVRMGGTGETSTTGLRLTPGFFFSPLFRPSLPVNEKIRLYGLIGFTVLAVGRTPAGNPEEIIARGGASIGVGADFYFDDHMAAGIELISYQHNVDYGPKRDYSNWTGVTEARVSLSSITASFTYQF